MPYNVKLTNPIHPVSLTLAQDANLNYIALQTFIWRNTWAATPTTPYNVYDVVYYNGSSYVNKTGSNSTNPATPASDTTNWDLMVQKGDTGAQGLSGAVAVTAPITLSGTSTNATIGINQSLITINPSQVTGTAVITTDSRLSDTRTPTDATVTSAKIAAAGISPASVTGTAVITTDSRLSDSRTPTGSAGGDLTGTYPNPTLAAVGTAQATAGVYKITTDAKGRVLTTATSSASDVGALGATASINIGTTSIPVNRSSASQSLTGISIDGNAGSVTNGFYTSSSFNLGTTSIAVNRSSASQSLTGINIDGSAGSVSAANITDTTLASNVTGSSLTSVGTLANLTVTNPISGGVTGNAGTVTNGVYTNAANTFTAGPQTINIDAIGNKGVVIKGAASQTANLQEWQSTYTTTVSAAGTTTVTGTGFLPAMLNGTLTVSGTSYTITGYTSSTSITINTAATFTSVSGTIIYASTLLNNNGVLWINGGSSSTAVDTITDVATLIPTDKFHQFSSSTTLGGAQRRLIGYVSTTSNIDIGQTSTGITRGINLKPGNGNQSSFVTGAQGYHSFFPPNYFSGAGASTTENGYLGTTEVLASGTWTSTGWTAGTGITITNVNNTLGSAVTYTTGSTAHGFVKDQTAIISGFTNNTGFNTTGAQIIAVPSTTTFTIPNSTATGTQPSPYGSVTSYAYTRSSGAAALSNSTTVSTSNYYQVTYTITGTNTTDQVTISLGGLSTTITTINGTTSGIWGPKPTATTGLSVDTTTNWTGTINISIRTISASTPVYQILDSTGNSAFEIRTSPTALTGGTGSIRNLFIGRLAGSRAVYNGTASTTTTATATTGAGQTSLVVASATGIAIGSIVSGTGIVTGTKVSGVSGTTITIDTATNASWVTGGSVTFAVATTSAIWSTGIGDGALSNLTTGSGNTAIGNNSGGSITTGATNTAVGSFTLLNATTASLNTAIGYNSLGALTTGNAHVAVGASALASATTGGGNTGVGYSALNATTTGGTNTAIGQQAGQSNTTGTANMFIGYFSGNGVTTGSQNVFVGREAGSTAIGQVNAVSNSIAIGYQTSTGASNQVVIGNTSITETRLQAPTVYGTNISLNALAAPTISSTSTAATGGTLAQNTTYYYVMTSINAAGVETVQGTEQSRLTGNTTATNTITLNWAIVPGATSYRIYRSTTSGSYASASYYAIAANYTITYTDTNATATGTATPPTAPVGSKTIFKPWVGQPTANTAGKLTEWQDSSGNTTAWIDPQGRLYFGSSSAGTLISGVSGTARFYATSDAVVTTVRANSTQTTNLQEWQNVGGTTLAAIGAAGALQLPYVADPGSITLTTAHYTVNYTTGTFTATLPAATTTAAAAGVTGRIYNIKNSGAGTITIAASGSDLIDGLATKTLSLQYSSLTVQSTGSGWIVIN